MFCNFIGSTRIGRCVLCRVNSYTKYEVRSTHIYSIIYSISNILQNLRSIIIHNTFSMVLNWMSYWLRSTHDHVRLGYITSSKRCLDIFVVSPPHLRVVTPGVEGSLTFLIFFDDRSCCVTNPEIEGVLLITPGINNTTRVNLNILDLTKFEVPCSMYSGCTLQYVWQELWLLTWLFVEVKCNTLFDQHHWLWYWLILSL